MTNEKLTVQVGLTPELRQHIDTAVDNAAGGARETINELRRDLRAMADELAKERAKSEGLGEKVDELAKRRTIILQRDDKGDWSIHDYNAVRDQATDNLETCELLHILSAIVHSEPGHCRFLQGSYADVRAENRRLSSANSSLVAQTRGDQQRIREYHDALEDMRKRLEEGQARVVLVKRETEFAPLADMPEIGTAQPGDRPIDNDFFTGEPFVLVATEPDAIKLDEAALVSLAELRPGEKFTVVSAIRALSAFYKRARCNVGEVQLKDGTTCTLADYLCSLDGHGFITAAQVEECAAAMEKQSGKPCTRVVIDDGFALPYATVLAMARRFDVRRTARDERDADLQRMAADLKDCNAVRPTLDELRALPHGDCVDVVNWCEAYRAWLNREPEAFDQAPPPRPKCVVLSSEARMVDVMQAQVAAEHELEAQAAADGFGLDSTPVELQAIAELDDDQAHNAFSSHLAPKLEGLAEPLFAPGSHLQDAEAVFAGLGTLKLPLRWLQAIKPEALAEVWAWVRGEIVPTRELQRVLMLVAEQRTYEQLAFDPGEGVPFFPPDQRAALEHSLRVMGYDVPEHDAQTWAGALCAELQDYVDAMSDSAPPAAFTDRYPRVDGQVCRTAAEVFGGIVPPGVEAFAGPGDSATCAGTDLSDYELLERQRQGIVEIGAYLDAHPEEVQAAMGEPPVLLGVDLAAEGASDRTVEVTAGADLEPGDLVTLRDTDGEVAAWPTRAEIDNGGPIDDEAAARAVIEDRPGKDWIQGISQP